MENKQQVDYIIVGQGIAGSCLALQLLLREKKILVYDQPSLNKSSAVAAGLYNPIVGKVMTRGWNSETLFPVLIDFYSWAEKFLGKKFFFPMPLYRPFNNIFEQNDWMAQSADPFFASCIDAIFLTSTHGNEVNDPFGGLLLKQCGYLDVPKFMSATRELLRERGAYREQQLDSKTLEITEAGFRYQDILTSKIVFCGGMEDQSTDFFSWLPLRPLKGETLEITVSSPLNRIYNKGVYVAPSSANSYKVGATYNPKDVVKEVTAAGMNELVEKTNELLASPYQIRSQEWGFRPCSWDRKPILGEHPLIKNIFVLNGLGTKGVSLAPYYSGHLADCMEGGKTINVDVSLKRIKKVAF